MKKVIFSIIAVLLLAVLLNANALKETSSSTPVITLTFSEESRITNATLYQGSTFYDFTYSPQKGDLSIFHSLTLTRALKNGNYTLFAQAEDRVANKINITQTIEVLVPYIFINLTNQPLGVSPRRVFDLVVETPGNASSCRYSPINVEDFAQILGVFESTNQIVHRKADFNNNSEFLISPQSEATLYVLCNQTLNGRMNPAI